MNLLNAPGSSAEWSPVAAKIVYSNWPTAGATSDLFIYDVASGTSTPITAHGPNQRFNRSAWSPDGSMLAVSESDSTTGVSDIWTMNADGSNPVNITGDWTTSSEGYPSWSSDGAYIVFTSDQSGNSDIWAMRPDGSERVNLTNTLGIDEQAPSIGPPPACDDFEDGVIDPTFWAWGGDRTGIGGPGSGSWEWSHEEVVATDGYFSIRVFGPTSGGTFGGWGWVRTRFDYNDGSNYIINFRWEADVNATHVDSYAIQVTSNDPAPTGDLFWYNNNVNPIDGPTWKNLYAQWNQPDMAPSDWSIHIDGTSNTATLFDGPNLTGEVISSATLPTDQAWYIRFIHTDGTSAGFPAGDNRLNIYDFCSERTPLGSPIPTVSAWGLVVMALLVLAAGTLVHTRRRATVRPT